MESLQGRVAVVTGAGSGIGKGLARALARQGASVVAADLSADAAQETAADLEGTFGTPALAVPTDVADPAAVEELAAATYDRFGAVHVLCNNAGVSTVGEVWNASLSDWKFVLGVNLMGPVHGIHSFLPRMLASGEEGHVVNVSSMGGLNPVPTKAPYTAAKHGLVGVTKNLRAELKAIDAPIGVSVVCPGAVATDMLRTQMNRYKDDTTLTPQSRRVLDGLMKAVEHGISIDEAGRIIVDGILANTFWIFPNAQPHFPELVRQYEEMGIGV
jgi:NAD(P)-dependent dehydrogenase (short-subunit alcohol dehydrogenase family)